MAQTTAALAVAVVILASCTDSHGILLGDAAGPDVPGVDVAGDPMIDPVPDPVIPDDPRPDIVDIVEEPSWPCTPEFADQTRTIMGGLSVSAGPEGDPDRPDLATLPGGEVWLSGRTWSSPTATDTPKLTLVIVNPRYGLPGSIWYHHLVNTDVDPYHPIAPLGDSLVVVYPDRGDFSANEILAMRMDMPPDSGELTAMPDTDIESIQPAVASLGSVTAVVWTQPTGHSEDAVIRFAIMDEDGTISASGSMGPGDPIVSRPAITSGPDEWGVACRYTYDDGWWFEDLSSAGETSGGRGLYHMGDMAGDVALAWNGVRYGILWEQYHWYMGPSSLLFLQIDSGDDPIDLTASLEATVGPLTADQQGMLDMTWNGRRFGVVWVHHDPEADRDRVWFFELDTEGTIVNGPHCLNPDATSSYNPTITWVETGAYRYYVFAWDEYSASTGTHVLYAYSYGCSI